jgi:DNA-directed RNA polymerase subunit F
MAEYTGKWDDVENELAEIAAELTALGDMIPGLFLNIEDMEPGTPRGIKILLADVRKRTEDLRKYVGGNFGRVNAGNGG